MAVSVADTAFATAACRAIECDRGDAVAFDPFARLLAGERGTAALAAIPGAVEAAGVLGVRTRLFDDLVMVAVREGFDTVVNLGAGLDTRAWRLPLPASVRWFDVDVQEVSDHKALAMASLQPGCHHECVSLDLSDGAALQAFLTRAGTGARRILVLSEGLLPYLAPSVVAQIAGLLRSLPSFTRWALTATSAQVTTCLQRVAGAEAAGHVGGIGAAFFARHGFRAVVDRALWADLERFGRAPVLPHGTDEAERDSGVRLLILEPSPRDSATTATNEQPEGGQGQRIRKKDRPLCGALRRTGKPCGARVVARGNGTLAKRCRMHGGCSTGPRTPEGRAKCGAVQRERWARWRAERAAVQVERVEGAA